MLAHASTGLPTLSVHAMVIATPDADLEVERLPPLLRLAANGGVRSLPVYVVM